MAVPYLKSASFVGRERLLVRGMRALTERYEDKNTSLFTGVKEGFLVSSCVDTVSLCFVFVSCILCLFLCACFVWFGWYG